MVMPGWVSPSCGPITWTIPWLGSPIPWSGIPNSAQLASSWLDLGGGHRVEDRQAPVGGRDGVVGGRDGLAGSADADPARAQAGERLRAGHLVDEVEVDRQDGRAPGSCDTTWSSQILSTMVRGWLIRSLGSRDTEGARVRRGRTACAVTPRRCVRPFHWSCSQAGPRVSVPATRAAPCGDITVTYARSGRSSSFAEDQANSGVGREAGRRVCDWSGSASFSRCSRCSRSRSRSRRRSSTAWHAAPGQLVDRPDRC